MSRRPPKRRCPACGGDHYAWQEHTVCRRCQSGSREDGATLAGMVREARLERRAQLELVFLPQEERLFPTDDIPY